ncbi:hypothetical protein NMY22_g3710 [Coprinellus aureogranulatus]|nr:hypothetical protein NMY22_g3710 [Coprinellus aureogranulatus]
MQARASPYIHHGETFHRALTTPNQAVVNVVQKAAKRRLVDKSEQAGAVYRSSSLERLDVTRARTIASEEVTTPLNSIKTTPYSNSFLSRLHGTTVTEACIAVDWDTMSPWMRLMSDIRRHYIVAGGSMGDEDGSMETIAPIVYTTLQKSHLPQVHELLERAFWTGIDVSDSLDYQPEKVTVVAMYKRLVVGVAIMSSPQETYITYLAVKAGWDKAQIAKPRNMLYHLISRNPQKDITLHVSANNSAMLLYNQFGFKAEEFVVGFYEDYMDPLSRASKNAFKLRLRQ